MHVQTVLALELVHRLVFNRSFTLVHSGDLEYIVYMTIVESSSAYVNLGITRGQYGNPKVAFSSSSGRHRRVRVSISILSHKFLECMV